MLQYYNNNHNMRGRCYAITYSSLPQSGSAPLCHAADIVTLESNADFPREPDPLKAKAGAHRAWLDNIARNYAPALRQFFERRLESKSDAADLVQDVFLRLSRMKVKGSIKKPEHYLFRTASNALRDHHRRNGVRHSNAHEPIEENGIFLDFSPAQIVEGRQAIHELERILKALPTRTRDVFVFRMLEERKSEDVAHLLGISTRAVEKHYAKALARITRALRAYRD